MKNISIVPDAINRRIPDILANQGAAKRHSVHGNGYIISFIAHSRL